MRVRVFKQVDLLGRGKADVICLSSACKVDTLLSACGRGEWRQPADSIDLGLSHFPAPGRLRSDNDHSSVNCFNACSR